MELLERVLPVEGCIVLLFKASALELMPGYSSPAIPSSRLVGVELGSTDTTDLTGNTRSVLDESKSLKGEDVLFEKGEMTVFERWNRGLRQAFSAAGFPPKVHEEVGNPPSKASAFRCGGEADLRSLLGEVGDCMVEGWLLESMSRYVIRTGT